MKILVAAVAFSSEMSGVQRHAFNVARFLLDRGEVSAVHLAIAPWQRKLISSAGLQADERLKVHLAQINPGSLSRNLWYYRELPLLAERERVDVVHFSYPAPLNTDAYPCPTVVTLHDLYPYEIPLNFGLRQILFNRLILQQCLRGADAIVCISQATLSRLKQYAPFASPKAVQIYNCVEPKLECAAQSPIPGGQGEPFLLCIAQHRRNKNIPLLIRAFARLLREGRIDQRMQLVVVGIGGPETARIRRLISVLGLQSKVHLLEGLSEPELQWCYRRCEALVAPSITEGFGAPVAEALLAGCRVVCSEIPAFREFAGEHCRFVALGAGEEEALADAVAASLREPIKAPVSLPRFSANLVAAQYTSLYRDLVASSPFASRTALQPEMRAAGIGRRS